jgi:hypothetical protein
MPMYHEGVIRTSSMGLFTPKDQLRDMQQHYAAQSLLGGNRRPDQQSMLLQSVAASLLLGSPVTVVDNDLLGDDLLDDDLMF